MSDALADVDRADLESYLATALGVDVAGTEVLADGLNLHVVISTGADDRAYVLRRPNKLRDTHYMNSLRGEYEVLRGLADTPVPAPVPVAYCEDESLLGRPFLVMDHLDGDPVPLGSDLPERFRDPSARERVAHELVDTLAAVHSVDVDRFEGACERWPMQELMAAHLDRLDAIREVTGREIPRLRAVGEWLRDNAPTNGATRLVHGDFRPSNVLFDDDAPEITAVLDWESSMLTDPLVELGYLLLRWRDDGDPTPSLDQLEARYPDHEAIEYLWTVEDDGLAPFTSNPGSPTRRALVDRYEAASGLSFEDERFYRAYAAFSLALVWADLDRHRIEAGDDPVREPHVDYMTMLGERIADGEFEL